MLGIPTNFICRPYRGLSFQETDVALEAGQVRRHLLGRLVYRRTEFLVLRNAPGLAVARVTKRSTEPLFSPVTDVQFLTGPAETVFIEDDTVDTANATQMARAALGSGMKGRIFVVQGRFQHVNLIVEPKLIEVRIVEAVPPEPPKLLEMARKVVEFDEALPPINLVLDPIDLRRLAQSAPKGPIMFPCRSSGLNSQRAVYFLDAGPPNMQEWTLVGCRRSQQIHQALYGSAPANEIDMCPRSFAPNEEGFLLTKCCLLESGIERDGQSVIVPWGSSLEEVRLALHRLVEPALDRGGG